MTTKFQKWLLAGSSCIFLCLLIFLHSCNGSPKAEDPPASQPAVVSSAFPTWEVDYQQDQPAIQANFDDQLWQTFIALAWPAKGLDPTADPDLEITDPTDRRSVFENYSMNFDLFLLPGKQTPHGWNQKEAIAKQRKERWDIVCPNLKEELSAAGIEDYASLLVLDEFIQASNFPRPHVPVIDQNGNYIRTSVLYNKECFDYVYDNRLYSVEGMREIAANEGQVTDGQDGKQTVVKFLDNPNGSIMLKSTWKILTPEDDASRYHTAKAVLFFRNENLGPSSLNKDDCSECKVPPTEEGYVCSQCTLTTVGLTGLHVTVKTEDQPDWLWATFEQVDNAPDYNDIDTSRSYTLFKFDANNVGPNNEPPAYTCENTKYTDGKWFNPEVDSQKTSQVVRLIPITPETKAINQKYQEALKGTVWANYRLISTQWKDPNEDNKVIPLNLSNLTLETFEQEASSCFGCHHQVRKDPFSKANEPQYAMGNVLNIPVWGSDKGDTLVYSDYMWSLFKIRPSGQLTWTQIAHPK